jgi:hypothetical protein
MQDNVGLDFVTGKEKLFQIFAKGARNVPFKLVYEVGGIAER